MFMIAEKNSQAVLGADTFERLKIFNRIFTIYWNIPAFLWKYQVCFTETGTLNTIQHIAVVTS